MITAIFCNSLSSLHYARVSYNQPEASGGREYLYHVGTSAYISCEDGKQIFNVQCQLCPDQNSTGRTIVGRTCQETVSQPGHYHGNWGPLPEFRCGTGNLGSNHISI